MLTKPRDPAKVLTQSTHKKRRSPLMLIGVTVTVLVALIGVAVFVVLPNLQPSHAAAALNMNCTLIVPPNPLSAQGLATPYQLVATNPGNGPCNEANAGQSAFVQADILDPATGQITSYPPLVIDKGTQPAVAPTPPTLPAHAVVALWFGFNATLLTLQNNAKTRGHGRHMAINMNMQGGANGNCVNGLNGSVFGQFAYCNAPNFFRAANAAIQAGTLKIPALGTASDGKPCMTTRDFGMVDMDQSDNVQTQYLANGNGQIAQNTAANKAALANATVLGNPSDNALLTAFLDPALGCTPFTVPNLADNNNPVATYGTDELMAAADQQAPIALVPGGDEMVLVNGNQSLTKTNLYRAGADQPPAASLTGTAATDANTTTYCQNIVNVGLPRLQLDMNMFSQKPSPDGGATANSLFTFLANRMNATLGAGGLNCVGLLNINNPIALTTTNNVVTAATLTVPPTPANGNNGNGNGNGGTTTATPTAPATTTTNTATGTVSVTLDTNAGNAQVANNLNIANFANQQFFVNVLGGAPLVANGVQGIATLTATSTTGTTPAAGSTPAAGTTPAAGATPTTTTTGGKKHHHHG